MRGHSNSDVLPPLPSGRDFSGVGSFPFLERTRSLRGEGRPCQQQVGDSGFQGPKGLLQHIAHCRFIFCTRTSFSLLESQLRSWGPRRCAPGLIKCKPARACCKLRGWTLCLDITCGSNWFLRDVGTPTLNTIKKQIHEEDFLDVGEVPAERPHAGSSTLQVPGGPGTAAPGGRMARRRSSTRVSSQGDRGNC